jgi:lysophospholipase L1-like esterase
MQLLFFCLPFFLVLSLAHAQTLPKPFVDGDIICCLGDSITHGGLYHKDIADFYATRFPDRKIKIINCGIGGDTATGALARLDWDVLAHHPTVITIMLGMNDVGHANYFTDSKTPVTDQVQAARAKAIQTYRAKMKEVIEAIRAHSKARIILITPSPYDEGVQMEGKPPRLGPNAALGQCAQIVKEFAASFNTELVEFWEPMNILNAEGQKADPKFTLCGADRVHPGAPGHLVMADLFLKAQGVVKPVPKIELDVRAGTVSADGAKAGNVTTGDHKWTFEVTESALPFPNVVTDPNPIYVRAAADLAGENFRANHVTDGKYRLTIDGVDLGLFRKRTLGREQVNLAESDAAPQVKQAKKIVQLGSERFAQQQVIRDIARMKKIVGPKVNVDDDAAFDAFAAQHLAQLKPETDAGKKWQADVKRFRDSKSRFNEAKDKIEALTKKIYESNQPKTHTWTLEKVSGKGA